MSDPHPFPPPPPPGGLPNPLAPPWEQPPRVGPGLDEIAEAHRRWVASAGHPAPGITHAPQARSRDAQRRAAAQAREEAEKKQRSREVARRAEQQRHAMLTARHQALPEFPVDGGALASELSAGLRKLVPDQARSFVVQRKSFGRTKSVRGWAFRFEAAEKINAHGGRYYRHRGLIVTDDGYAYVVAAESPSESWTVGDYTHGQPPSATLRVGVHEVQKIVDQVLKWTGRSQGTGTTPARTEHLERLVSTGRMSHEEAERLAPNGAVSDVAWATIRTR